MTSIIGQDRLISCIDSFSVLPRTILIEGKKGSGKHLITNYIASKHNLPVEDITDSLTIETIDSINLRVEPHLYVIDSSKISIREQNIILKFIEEPLKNAYIIILVDDASRLLETVRNRCFTLKLYEYTKECLLTFVPENIPENIRQYIISIATTPGEVKLFSDFAGSIEDMKQLADKMFEKIGTANFSNVLSISNKIAFKNEQDKFNIDVFIPILLKSASTAVREKFTFSHSSAYNATLDLQKDSKIPHVDMKYLFENYLCVLSNIYG